MSKNKMRADGRKGTTPAKAPKAEAPATEEVQTSVGAVETQPHTTETKFALGPKKYGPKVGKNERTWSIIQGQLASGPKTLKQLQDACKGDDFHHVDFVGYMVRGQHISPVAAE